MKSKRKKSLCIVLVLFTLICATVTQTTLAQRPFPRDESYAVFYLAVGSSDYQTYRSPGPTPGTFIVNGFAEIDGARKSARKVASYLDAGGAVLGITLVSDSSQLVSRDDVFRALDQVLEAATRSKAKNRLLVFYFCGHGLSEGVGWNHFSIPGDFGLPGDRIDVSVVAARTIFAGDVADRITARKMSFLLLLDNCYEGEKIPELSAVMSRELIRNVNDIAAILRFPNEFRGPDMAVFAGPPGSFSKTVADPDDLESAVGVGRISRRLALILAASAKKKKAVTIADLLLGFNDSLADKETTGIFSLSKPAFPRMVFSRRLVSLKPPSRIIFGTARPKSADQIAAEVLKQTTDPPRETRLFNGESRLEFVSPPGEFIGSGLNASIVGGDAKFKIVEESQSSLTIEISTNESSWEIEITAPNGAILRKGIYRNAERAAFQSPSIPGFSFSGESRACGSLRAEFEIVELQRGVDKKITHLDLKFSQRCDETALILEGNLVLQ